MIKPRVCFVAMPFRPELNLFYLYIKHYLEDKFGIVVERGDTKILTKPLMGKLRDQIINAHLVIADISGNNANVFYEVGLAHANSKDIIFLTQDEADKIPIDIRQYEVVQYSLINSDDVVSSIDRAVMNFFGQDYESLFSEAQELLSAFNRDVRCSYQSATFDEFQARVMQVEKTVKMPEASESGLRVRFLLPKVVKDFTDADLISRYTDWLRTK